ncbi:tyrosine-protein kinase transmembrane receptor Ror2-like [Babylonia areolata]|uniref:tyrosine-protein kinase transmembrane receptor Ror2-like n=1 Tax=Babylonia areolata TaxID=304850 RepID=UPI003FD364E6
MAIQVGGGDRDQLGPRSACRHWVPFSLALLTWIATSTASVSDLRITTPPRSQTVLNNKRLKLPCRAQGGGLPIRIRWFKDDQFMFRMGHNYRISDRSGTLRFTRVTVFDRGEYVCKASNDFFQVQSDPAQLTVHAEAELIRFPQAELVRPFSVLCSLTCEAAGIPLPYIQWRVDGVSITEPYDGLSGVLSIEESETTAATWKSTLHINSTTSVQLECEAVNQHVEGVTVVSKRTDLIVRPPAGPADHAFAARWRGVCQPYNGSVCRDQLGGKMVYHNVTARSAPTAFPTHDDPSHAQEEVYESEHEEIVRALLEEMRGTGMFTGMGGGVDEYCLRPALELMCHYAFPDCRFTVSGHVMPVPICRESCLAVQDLFCFRQWVEVEEKKKQKVFFKKRGHFRLPDCEALPSVWEPGHICTQADVHAEATPQDVTDKCYVGTGQWYNGTVNVTSSGLACQAWTANYPQQHERSPLVFPELRGAENFCRNPGSEEDRPWCYTTLLEKRWEFCDVPKCGADNSTLADSTQLEESPKVTLVAIIIISVVSAVGIIIISLSIALLLNILRRRRGSHHGYKAAAKDDVDAAIAQLPDNAAYHQVRTGKLNPKLEGYEFPRNNIVFLRDIGQGAFGRVFKAKVAGSNSGSGRIKAGESTLIAVKMLKEDASEDLQLDFEREASLMADFDHPNIVRLLGVCAVGKPMCLLFEFMSKGDLNEFLRLCSPEQFSLRIPRSRDHTVDLEDGLRVEVEEEEEEEAGREEGGGEESPARLSTSEQVYIAGQVAGGMAYLAHRGYVHRDLATRNCLVGHHLVVKISDFGLARSVHSVDYYRGSEQDAVPIRWMPLEAILYNKFSTQSDVWSFGVVLWEIFAFALQPYYGLTHEEVVRYLKEGKVLAQPDRTPQQVYDLMKQCWHRRPTSRPAFHTLHNTLENLYAKLENNEVKLKEVV